VGSNRLLQPGVPPRAAPCACKFWRTTPCLVTISRSRMPRLVPWITLLAMLSTALQISRAEVGIGRDRFIETDLSALLADLVEIYGPVAEDQGMILTCSAPKDLTLAVHRELLSQALGNLIENALKYAHGGGKISLTALAIPNGVLLSVADDGSGIPEELRNEARKKFGRLDPARSISGAGLGMALVEAIAKLHGGDITLEDNAPGLKVVMTIKV